MRRYTHRQAQLAVTPQPPPEGPLPAPPIVQHQHGALPRAHEVEVGRVRGVDVVVVVVVGPCCCTIITSERCCLALLLPCEAKWLAAYMYVRVCAGKFV